MKVREEICPYFGECGGCSLQDIEYSEQLDQRKQRLVEYLKYYEIYEKIREFKELVQSPQIWYYRNKMEFSFSQKNNKELILGLHKKQRVKEIVDIKECAIFSKKAIKIARCLLELFNKEGYSAYDVFKRKGGLRHLVLREAKFTQELMINIVTTSAQQLNKEKILKTLQEYIDSGYVKSVYHTINDSPSDAVIFKECSLLAGREYIIEKLGNLYFKIYPQSFFQTNPYCVLLLYQNTQKYSDFNKEKKVLDLYCGAGVFSLFLAENSREVKGIELNSQAVKNAFENAGLNKINNAEFLEGDVAKVLYFKREEFKNTDLIICNPPRAGVNKKVLKRIFEINPKYIIYVSCNPQSLSENLYQIKEKVSIKFIEPYDFFPHTLHLETLAFLEVLK